MMKFIIIALSAAISSIEAASATARNAYVIDSVAFSDAVNEGIHYGNRKNVDYWKTGAVIGGFNDYSRSVGQFNTMEEMYNACYDFCMAHKCNSFDLVPYKGQCYLDTTSKGNPSAYEKRDLGSAYVKVRAGVSSKPTPPLSMPVPTPQQQPPLSMPVPTPQQPKNQNKCFGIGLHWISATPYIADTLPSNADVKASLTEQCGNDAECGKWYTCANSCGALAVPPDAIVSKRHMGQGIQFAASRVAAEQAALSQCQKRLDGEGMTGTCEVVASFCNPNF